MFVLTDSYWELMQEAHLAGRNGAGSKKCLGKFETFFKVSVKRAFFLPFSYPHIYGFTTYCTYVLVLYEYTSFLQTVIHFTVLRRVLAVGMPVFTCARGMSWQKVPPNVPTYYSTYCGSAHPRTVDRNVPKLIAVYVPVLWYDLANEKHY